MRVRYGDLGIFPLLLIMPFVFYPKVLEGDTQPWLLVAGVIAFLTFRTDRFFLKRDGLLISLSFLCIVTYALRNPNGYEVVRHTYTYLTFVIFWTVCQRENGEYFSLGVRAAVIVWFCVGLYQFLGVKFGYQIEISGRYIEGRSGVPGLTAEASYYGSISVLHLMYLLSDKSRKNGVYVFCALASVIMSGSALALLLLVFPLLKLPVKMRFTAFLVLPLVIIFDYATSSSGVIARLFDISSNGMGMNMFLLDPSVNLRAGHIYFTLFDNLASSLTLAGPINFMDEYNDFAGNAGILVPTGSNYILPSMGEMIYGSGFLAALFLIIFLKRVQETCATVRDKIEKTFFIIVCMMNPIPISNIFLIVYAVQKGRVINEGYSYRRGWPRWLLYDTAAIKQRNRGFGVDNRSASGAETV